MIRRTRRAVPGVVVQNGGVRAAPPLAWLRTRATAVALAVSAFAHLFFLVGLPVLQLLRIEAPIPIEILPLKKRAPAPPSLPVPPAGEATPPKPRTPGDGDKPKPKPQPQPPAAEDLRAIGPASTNVTIILRGPLLAKSPHRDGVDTLLSALPDYHTLLDGTGLHPFDDLDALMISTPDPRDVTATFLAARHRGNPRIVALSSRSLGGLDPRQFYALGADLMLLGRPDDLTKIAAAVQHPTDPPDEGTRWLLALQRFDDAAKDAAFLLTIADLPALIRVKGGVLPLPRTIRLAMSAEGAPATRLVLSFDDERQAVTFAVSWPDVKEKVADSAPMFSGVFDDLKLVRNGKEVELAGRLPQAQVTMALGFVKLVTPRQPRPATPPDPPPGTPLAPSGTEAPPQPLPAPPQAPDPT